MTRIFTAILAVAVAAAGVGEERKASEGAAPELVVSLAPATGFVPLDTADRLAPYRFQLSAVGAERRYSWGSGETLVEPGRSGSFDKSGAGGRVRASVKLAEDGLASDTAELLVGGKTVARTSATVRFLQDKSK